MRLRSVKFMLFCGVFLRVCVALWNGFWGPSFGAEADARFFHLEAVSYAARMGEKVEFAVGYIYSYLLGVFYFLTTDSLFLGSLLSVIFWYFSASILVRIMRLLFIENASQYKAMLIYALLPSSILFTSITMRETYQLFFVNLAIYSALKIYLKRSKKDWIFLVGSVVGMSALHTALLGLGLFVIAATIFMLIIRNNKKLPIFKIVMVLPFIIAFMAYGLLSTSGESYRLGEGLDVAVQGYVEGGLATAARTDYKESINIQSTTDLLLYLPVSLFQYLFEPMPWKISSTMDIGTLLENLLRVWLLWRILKGFSKLETRNRRPVLFIFFSYLVIETIWSLGTINWGTAMRHHIPASALLVAASYVCSNKRGLKKYIKPKSSNEYYKKC